MTGPRKPLLPAAKSLRVFFWMLLWIVFAFTLSFTLSSAEVERSCVLCPTGELLPDGIWGGSSRASGRTSKDLPLLRSLLKATPKVPTTPVKARRTSTFQEFESNTSDAWDASEDDDELLAMAAESLNTEVVMETANRVLRNHSQRQERRRPPEPPAVPSSDLRLVKSVSESHTSCPAGGMGAPSRRGAFLREKGPESSPCGRLGGFCSGCGSSSLSARGGLFFALPAERFSPPSAGASFCGFCGWSWET